MTRDDITSRRERTVADGSLRPTTAADLDFVVGLEADPAVAPYVDGWPRQRHAASLGDPDIRHFVLERDGHAVGYAIMAGFERGAGAIEIRRIAVAPRGEGVGRAAVRACIEIARAAGADRVWLDVYVTNERARRLYESVGFEWDGSTSAGPRGDLVILTLRLDRPTP